MFIYCILYDTYRYSKFEPIKEFSESFGWNNYVLLYYIIYTSSAFKLHNTVRDSNDCLQYTVERLSDVEFLN